VEASQFFDLIHEINGVHGARSSGTLSMRAVLVCVPELPRSSTMQFLFGGGKFIRMNGDLQQIPMATRISGFITRVVSVSRVANCAASGAVVVKSSASSGRGLSDTE
jgi:hypothetical protein